MEGVVVPINELAVLLCGVLAMVLGFLWYGPIFGKIWMKLEGMPDDAMERAKNDPAAMRKMYRSYAIQFVFALLMAYAFAHMLVFAQAYLGISGISSGLQGAFWLWVGFVVPPTSGMVLWEGKPWKLWMLVSGYWLVLMLIMGAVLGFWA